MTDAQTTTLRDIDEPHYNYLQALYLSFFSNRLYVDVGRRWKGFSLLYLFLVFLIVALPFSLRLILNFDDYFNKQIILPLKSLPPFYIQNGIVSLDKPMPYFIKNNSGKVIAIIDTTGTINKIDEKFPDLSILIVKDRLFYRVPDPQPLISKSNKTQNLQINEAVFNPNMNQYFDSNQWISTAGIGNLKLISQVIIYPTVVLALFFMYLVFFLVIAVLAQVVSLAIFRFSLSYKQAFRLLIVAATPHLAALMIILAFDWMFMGLGLFLVSLVAMYFSYAVLSLKRDSNKLVTA
ncbi:Protein of uncharacterised function (DUF1189) [Legionella beliardensis]|uniref:Protein of uncharacterized function (DUF1189) n=1 Tax=Legionella beliardensis TaxID=91822 RepID=A0A378I259_9GAMM|nr:DUF1189 family protein [Legionella beliardensis]STX29277.1 Protein of uncharacterised function (DUF1189) [Legionella beliardensis]